MDFILGNGPFQGRHTCNLRAISQKEDPDSICNKNNLVLELQVSQTILSLVNGEAI